MIKHVPVTQTQLHYMFLDWRRCGQQQNLHISVSCPCTKNLIRDGLYKSPVPALGGETQLQRCASEFES